MLKAARVRANPYPHQLDAIRWWTKRERGGQDVGGILADDKGLGKTMESIAAILLADRHAEALGYAWSPPNLIVCPLAVLDQWVEEIETHSELDVATQVVKYHGSEAERKRITLASLQSSNVQFVLTTYDTMRSDESGLGFLHRVTWRRIVLDEADRIRTPTTAVSQSARRLKSPKRFCLTGTPINNSAADIHTLAAFVNVSPYNTPQWWSNAGVLAQQNWTATYVLRRLKTILKLPTLHRETVWLPLSDEQRRVYSTLEADAILYFQQTTPTNSSSSSSSSRGADSKDGTPAGGETESRRMQRLLEWLLRLRQAACHPMLAFAKAKKGGTKDCAGCGRARPPAGAPMLREWTTRATCMHAMCAACAETLDRPCTACGALQRQTQRAALSTLRSVKQRALVERIQAFLRAQPDAKMLIYSNWTSFLDLIQADLLAHNLASLRIDGKVLPKERQAIRHRFCEDESKNTERLLCATMKAGGVGLNLARANIVFVMDGWYNPAAESQAVDRVYRIGQTREVHVVRLLTDTLVERAIESLQQDKLTTAADFLQEARPTRTRPGDDEKDDEPGMSMLTRTFSYILAGRRAAAAAAAAQTTAAAAQASGPMEDEVQEWTPSPPPPPQTRAHTASSSPIRAHGALSK
jgi:DNA repair protein RAD5